jgi:very-short-patch-repair endonuclease
VTSPERTVIDLAEVVSQRLVERMIDEADRLRLCSARDLAEAVARHPGRAGARTVGCILARHDVGSTVTRSELEELFLTLCRAQGLPTPEVNARLEEHTVDFLWRAERLIVETDGWESHRTRSAYERDRERDALLALRGYLVVRFTYRQVVAEPKVVATRLHSLLRARRPS